MSTFLTLNGDFLSGTSFLSASNGKVAVLAMNQLGVDICVIGNHEFSFGTPELIQRMEDSNFLWLGTNLLYKPTGRMIGRAASTHIQHFQQPGQSQPLKVGFFGVCTPAALQIFDLGGVDFLDVVESSSKAVKSLQEQGVDAIVGITHLSLDEDRKLARSVAGIHVLMGGHDHTPFAQFQGTTLIFKCGENAHWLGVVDLTFKFAAATRAAAVGSALAFDPCPSTSANASASVFVSSYQMLAVKDEIPDKDVVEVIKVFEAEALRQAVEGGMDPREELARFQGGLCTLSELIRKQEADAGRMMADICLDLFPGATMGLIIGGQIRGSREYADGHIFTVGDLMKETGDSPLCCVAIKAKWLCAALEQHLRPLGGSFPHISVICHFG